MNHRTAAMHIEEPATHSFIDVIEVDFQPQQLPPLQTLLNSNQSCELLNQVSQIVDINPASELATTLQAIAEKLRQFLDTQQVVIYSIHGNDSTVAPNSLISSPNLNHTDSNQSIAVPIFIRNFSISGAFQLGHGTEFVIEICTSARHNADIKKHAQL